MELKQVNVRVRGDTKKKLKLLALDRGITLQELVQEVLENHLKGCENNEEE